MAAGAGGVIINRGGTTVYFFAWSPGISTNNQAEAYTFLQGLKLAINVRIQSVILVGDSKNVIRHVVLDSKTLDSWLASVFERIR